MKIIKGVVLASVLILSACAPTFDKEEEIVQTNENNKRETAFVPSFNVSEEEYKIIYPYKPSQARGVIVNQMANRLDIDVFEVGLRDHAKSYFDPDLYFFQEGQRIDSNTLYNWLSREGETSSGLNPVMEGPEDAIESHQEAPKYLSHILEHDFLKKNEDGIVELKGMSIGIALKSTYRFQTEVGGPYYYQDIPEKVMVKEGKEIANEVIQRIRQMEGLEEVPIVVALFREEDQNAMSPGNFVAKTVVEVGGAAAKQWQDIDEDYVLFPSNEAAVNYNEESQLMQEFTDEIARYFPNYVGVIGNGFYKDGELAELNIQIPIEFQGKAEVVGFTQYVYGLVMETFPNYFKVEVQIHSHQQQESVIVREAGETDPFVYLYQ
ncbi:CamS family sex pheromone protein [Bacillaceae bacterium S4-13-58]